MLVTARRVGQRSLVAVRAYANQPEMSPQDKERVEKLLAPKWQVHRPYVHKWDNRTCTIFIRSVASNGVVRQHRLLLSSSSLEASLALPLPLVALPFEKAVYVNIICGVCEYDAMRCEAEGSTALPLGPLRRLHPFAALGYSISLRLPWSKETSRISFHFHIYLSNFCILYSIAFMA